MYDVCVICDVMCVYDVCMIWCMTCVWCVCMMCVYDVCVWCVCVCVYLRASKYAWAIEEDLLQRYRNQTQLLLRCVCVCDVCVLCVCCVCDVCVCVWCVCVCVMYDVWCMMYDVCVCVCVCVCVHSRRGLDSLLAAVISSVIRINLSVTTVDVSHNNIGPTGVCVCVCTCVCVCGVCRYISILHDLLRYWLSHTSHITHTHTHTHTHAHTHMHTRTSQ